MPASAISNNHRNTCHPTPKQCGSTPLPPMLPFPFCADLSHTAAAVLLLLLLLLLLWVLHLRWLPPLGRPPRWRGPRTTSLVPRGPRGGSAPRRVMPSTASRSCGWGHRAATQTCAPLTATAASEASIVNAAMDFVAYTIPDTCPRVSCTLCKPHVVSVSSVWLHCCA